MTRSRSVSPVSRSRGACGQGVAASAAVGGAFAVWCQYETTRDVWGLPIYGRVGEPSGAPALYAVIPGWAVRMVPGAGPLEATDGSSFRIKVGRERLPGRLGGATARVARSAAASAATTVNRAPPDPGGQLKAGRHRRAPQ